MRETRLDADGDLALSAVVDLAAFHVRVAGKVDAHRPTCSLAQRSAKATRCGLVRDDREPELAKSKQTI